MRRILKPSVLGSTALAGLLAIATGLASPAHAATVPNSVASWVGTASKVGTAPAAKPVTIVVHMALRNVAQLKTFVASVSTPGNPAYGKYLTPAAFSSEYAPAASDAAAAAAFLTAAGMKNVTIGPAQAYVTADTTVAQIMKTFSVTQGLYSHGGGTLRANAEVPTIPAGLAGKIRAIEGLNDTNLRIPQHYSATQGPLVAPARLAAASSSIDASAITPPPVAAALPSPYCSTYFDDAVATLSTAPAPYSAKLPWLACGYTPQQVREAYGLSKVTADGTGVTIAIVDAFASPTLKQDGNAYAAKHHLGQLSPKNFTQVIPAGAYDVPPDQVANAYGWWGEQSLDLAAVHGSAPGASIVYIGAVDNGSSLTTALTNAIYNHLADIITNSYSYGGEPDTADLDAQDETFMAADAMGITLLFSSGDDGDLSQINGLATAAFESDSPYVTGVGGTSLLLYGPTNKREFGWGNYRDYLTGAMVNSVSSITTTGAATTSAFGYTYDAFTFYSGAGGGISVLEPEPDYQKTVVPKALATTLVAASGTAFNIAPRRVSPDISMVADPYTGYLYGESFTTAGNAVSDSGCTAKTSTTEYCEGSIGGTSLASPLTAGMLAVVDQVRKAHGKPVVGFANPWLYAAKIGTIAAPLGVNDITPPAQPTAVLRGYANDATRVRVVSINSVPFNIATAPYALFVCAVTLCQGTDDIFNYTTAGYDDVTGLGVPYAPALTVQ